MADKPLILLTNDDGVQAVGLHALRQALRPHARVVVVAPLHEQSASSHSITLKRPLRHVEHETDVHSVDGTPADCVYLALAEGRFLPARPDLVVAGINHGLNIASDVFYSGTVAGAREGAIRGIPSVAVSYDGQVGLEAVAGPSRDLIVRLLQSERAPGEAPLLNVNFPHDKATRVVATRLGRRLYAEEVVMRHDPSGREYFWIGSTFHDERQPEGTDAWAIEQGFATVTPLLLDATSAEHLALAAYVANIDSTEDP